MTDTKLCDRECVVCGVPMWRKTEPTGCDKPGCCVLHVAEVVRCEQCGGTIYTYTSVPETGADS